jgi:hypothetical protein
VEVVMKRFIKSFLREITSRDTWEQVKIMMSKPPPRGKAITNFTKENYIPLIISLVITIISLIIIGTFLHVVVGLIKSAGPQGGHP